MPTHNTTTSSFSFHPTFRANHPIIMSMELRKCTKNKPIMLTIILFIILCLSSSTFASDSFISSSVLGTDQLDQPRLSTSRALLQAQKPCPINFENQNYTIITSRCKGPRYLAADCCPSFTDFACQFADQLNDLTNQCAQTMFSYINLNGGYPPGLFANECKGSKRGLECKNTPSGAASIYALTRHGSLLLLLSAVVFLLVIERIL